MAPMHVLPLQCQVSNAELYFVSRQFGFYCQDFCRFLLILHKIFRFLWQAKLYAAEPLVFISACFAFFFPSSIFSFKSLRHNIGLAERRPLKGILLQYFTTRPSGTLWWYFLKDWDIDWKSPLSSNEDILHLKNIGLGETVFILYDQRYAKCKVQKSLLVIVVFQTNNLGFFGGWAEVLPHNTCWIGKILLYLELNFKPKYLEMPVWLARVWDSLANPQSWNFPPERFSMLSLHHCGGVK